MATSGTNSLAQENKAEYGNGKEVTVLNLESITYRQETVRCYGFAVRAQSRGTDSALGGEA